MDSKRSGQLPTEEWLICNEPEVPETLFHYTSLESLASILRNRTLRLMPLSTLDDPQEAQTIDAPGVGNFHFVSCWTDDKRESIPMWNMYASLQSGVRIELENDPFVRYEYSEDDCESLLGLAPGHADFGGGTMRTFLPFEDFVSFGFSRAFIAGHNVLRRVQYTSEYEKLVPRIIKNNDLTDVDLDKVASFKNEYWSFQREWRYVIGFLPLNLFDISEDVESWLGEAFDKLISGRNAQLLPFYDLRISDDAIRRMRITPSPKMSDGYRVLMEHLLSAYGLDSNVEESALLGLL